MTKRRQVPVPEVDDPDSDEVGTADLPDASDEMVYVVAGPVPVMLPSSMMRLAKADPRAAELFALIQANVFERHDLVEQLGELVAAARDAGVSWAHIGWCVGTTGEGARRRWS